MNRGELIAHLVGLVRSGKLAAPEAAAFVARFDAGTLSPEDLPSASAADGLSVALALAAMALLSNAFFSGAPVGAISVEQRVRATIAVMDGFDAAAYRATSGLGRGRLAHGSVGRWHDEALQALRRHALMQAQMGAGRVLTPEELARVARHLRFHEARLRRFAVEIAALQDAGRDMTTRAIYQRLRLYGAAPTALFYEFAETTYPDGYVIDFVGADDGGTCSPCLAAMAGGPYLPGEGPIPGAVCLGRGKCRHRRQRRYAPEEAARLRGAEESVFA